MVFSCFALFAARGAVKEFIVRLDQEMRPPRQAALHGRVVGRDGIPPDEVSVEVVTSELVQGADRPERTAEYFERIASPQEMLDRKARQELSAIKQGVLSRVVRDAPSLFRLFLAIEIG
jgi:hypothetical protein